MAIERVSAVAIFADIDFVPKVLLARRRDGTYTLPGGKQENESTYRAGVRELWEETGLTLLPNTRLRRMRTPVSFMVNDHPIVFSLFYTWIGKSIPHEYMVKWTEMDKTEPWRWYPLAEFRDITARGLFPELACKMVISAAKKISGPWIGDMTLYEYDFPHAGLHSARSLRRTLHH